jgi:integrative and conjugative element protein (TIGR02256 family)
MNSLIISRQAFKKIRGECLRYRFLETGGIMVGRREGDDLVVPFVIGPGPRAARTWSRFEPDVDYQQKRLERYFELFGINYVGSFHRHPGKFSEPSLIDHRTAVGILTDAGWVVAEAAFPIILVENRAVVIYPYYICRRKLRFEPMTMYVVPDDHDVITRITKENESKCNRL